MNKKITVGILMGTGTMLLASKKFIPRVIGAGLYFYTAFKYRDDFERYCEKVRDKIKEGVNDYQTRKVEKEFNKEITTLANELIKAIEEMDTTVEPKTEENLNEKSETEGETIEKGEEEKEKEEDDEEEEEEEDSDIDEGGNGPSPPQNYFTQKSVDYLSEILEEHYQFNSVQEEKNIENIAIEESFDSNKENNELKKRKTLDNKTKENETYSENDNFDEERKNSESDLYTINNENEAKETEEFLENNKIQDAIEETLYKEQKQETEELNQQVQKSNLKEKNVNELPKEENHIEEFSKINSYEKNNMSDASDEYFKGSLEETVSKMDAEIGTKEELEKDIVESSFTEGETVIVSPLGQKVVVTEPEEEIKSLLGPIQKEDNSEIMSLMEEDITDGDETMIPPSYFADDNDLPPSLKKR